MNGFLYRAATDSEAAKDLFKQLEEQEAIERDEFFNGDDEELSEEEYSAYTLTGSYEETLVNRLDNLLAVNILSACFLFLLFYYTMKRR